MDRSQVSGDAPDARRQHDEMERHLLTLFGLGLALFFAVLSVSALAEAALSVFPAAPAEDHRSGESFAQQLISK